jgi:hypothetical protein
MRLLVAGMALWLSATAALANADTNRLVDAMGLPALLRAFALEGEASGASLNDSFLNGQGGAVWAETVSALYDPARLESELRAGLAATLDPDIARTALIFFDSAQGQRIIALEVQARAAMLDEDVEAMARSAGTQADAQVVDFLTLRDLIRRNTDAAVTAQTAFFAGMSETLGNANSQPDIEGQRPMISGETESWLKGYYVLIQSALEEGDLQSYSDFWRTAVGRAVDDAVFEVFADNYTSLSYGLGQAAGRLLPPREL